MKFPPAAVQFRAGDQESAKRRERLAVLLSDPIWLSARDAALLEMTVLLQNQPEAHHLLRGAHILLGQIESLAEPPPRPSSPISKLPELP